MTHRSTYRLANEIYELIEQGRRVWQDEGDRRSARRFFQDALNLARHFAFPLGIVSAQQMLGHLADDEDDLRRAIRHHEAVLADSRRYGMPAGEASALHCLGLLNLRAGKPKEGFCQLNEALERYEDLGLASNAQVVRSNIISYIGD